MLADISKLERGRRGDFGLRRQVPLLIDRGLNGLIPYKKDSSLERITRHGAPWTLLRLVCGIVVDGGNFRWRERWISCKTQVRTRPLKVGGDSVGTTKDRLASPKGGRPGEAYAGLKVRPSIDRVIKRAAVAAYACIFDLPGNEVEVVLSVVEFHPRRTGFITKSKIQREGGSNTPVVLTVSTEPPCHLVPRSAGAHSNAGCAWIASEEVRGWIASECASEQDGAVFSAVTAVEGIEPKTPHLEAGVDHMFATGDDHTVVKLNHGVGKSRIFDRVANIGECSRATRRRSGAAVKAKQQKTRPGGVGISNPEFGTQ